MDIIFIYSINRQYKINLLYCTQTKEEWLIGLDNGIEVRRTQQANKIEELKIFNLDYDKKLECDFEICYWRKCYGLRNDILCIIGKRWYPDEYEFKLTKNDIDNIIKLLGSYNEETWEDSIWEWTSDEDGWSYSEHIKRDIENLKLLRQLMDKYDLEVYFYDSY